VVIGIVDCFEKIQNPDLKDDGEIDRTTAEKM